MEIMESGTESDEAGTIFSAYALATASLWVDGLRIYEATNLGMRIVAGREGGPGKIDEILDPETDIWLNDHLQYGG